MSSSPPGWPRISVVVPSYNQGGFLREALASIFRQGYPDLEVVVMDGGSTDDSVAVIRSFAKRLTYWQSRKDGGQSAAINAGMEHCTGQLVAWLNSDDYYWRDALWTVGRAYAAHPGFGLYLGNGLRYDQAAGRYAPFSRRHVVLNREALRHGLDYLLQPACFFLREAWREAGGLHEDLHFCMDWDVLLRIAGRHPAVLINEFLAVSREYQATKTSTGAMRRAEEIGRVIREHTQAEVTPGSLYFLLETLLGVTAGQGLDGLRSHLWAGMVALQGEFARRFGAADSFPAVGDPQDRTYLPLPATAADDHAAPLVHPPDDFEQLPSVSIVTPSFNQAEFLGQTLDSILAQNYPRLETIVLDAGSTDGSVDVLRRYADRLSYWVSEPDRGPAQAINKGFQRASGEILAWVNSDDLLTPGAVWEAARLFAEDPDLDLVYGNALYIDERNDLVLADHGSYRTGLYYGDFQPTERIPRYWNYVHAVPQPTVFFRRRLLEACGHLDESYQFIFDFELFFRFAQKARIRKLERTQAFYRIHTRSKTSDWNRFLVELYRFSRPRWPALRSRHFLPYVRDYVGCYMKRRWGNCRRDWRFWARAGIAALAATTRLGNPETFFLPPRPKKATGGAPFLPEEGHGLATAGPVVRACSSRPAYRSLFLSYLLPYHPGHFGGEIRDFYLLRHLLSVSRVEFFALYPSPPEGRADLLGPYLEAAHLPAAPTEVPPLPSRVGRGLSRLRRGAASGPKSAFHQEAAVRLPEIEARWRAPLQAVLAERPPDFLFVSPQTNPVALRLGSRGPGPRLILASYDVETVRMRRLADTAKGWPQRRAARREAERARRFEEINLACYDGLIAVSDLDKEIFVREFGFPPERVLVVPNGIDPSYFAFTPRRPDQRQAVLFVGSLGYAPNRQAALRLRERILPRVWQQRPGTNLWIVGPGADGALTAHHDGSRTFVTGRVEDVRPYLAAAALLCVPLLAGSGTKYKVLEAMAAGLPVVGSPLAAEGLDVIEGQHLLVGDSDAQLADAILRVLAEPDLGGRLAAQGRSLVENRYTWDIALAGLSDWLAMLAQLPRRNNLDRNRGEAVAPVRKAG
ncbi:MAG: glycosyltransferase [Planctomycetes bacterium]|nr:glycosyltransferase [Planctomycetota bacterium]